MSDCTMARTEPGPPGAWQSYSSPYIGLAIARTAACRSQDRCRERLKFLDAVLYRPPGKRLGREHRRAVADCFRKVAAEVLHPAAAVHWCFYFRRRILPHCRD